MKQVKSSDQLDLFTYINQKKLNKLELFISYSHEDEKFIEGFEKYTSSLKDKINFWRDHKMLAGENLKAVIQKKNMLRRYYMYISFTKFSSI
ncbi:MAG: hypothetical protein OXJ52_08440 [Oligoflexia bacterium]|nr:hypothetical protein [Oligoflexia bacterium]